MPEIRAASEPRQLFDTIYGRPWASFQIFKKFTLIIYASYNLFSII